jgi:hypothetical protein
VNERGRGWSPSLPAPSSRTRRWWRPTYTRTSMTCGARAWSSSVEAPPPTVRRMNG